ncbi:thiamine biosynthesis protein ApbE [Anaerobacillus arseniciselenatis]|uniref:FAD:protein FMN transferase n=1 Tax=Anaerobacillus arseniciselenatis TaxID=85682 RepID=A0A1S2L6W4_9BACI|nr:FAD:protein FMN transferase [Anaerobacillus arseniciselenatis]OIJ08222.1 thiamine biosynthesis protein ApbE [Anaerobacillus arseniciselenatis]
MRKITWSIVVMLLITACSNETQEQDYQRYSTNFLDAFDTVTQVIGYARSEEEFYEYAHEIKERFWEFHKLYDKYNEYEDINNIMTINNNAGIQPVEVDQEIIDIILFSKEWYERTHGKMNIALGSLIEIWDETMTLASEKPEQAALPLMEKLKAASIYTNIDDVIVDEEAMTVFLAEENMSIDLGAIAKGYAAEIVGKEMIEKGFTSGVIISGGNWKVLGPPKDLERDHWTVGVQNPEKPYALNEEAILERVKLEEKSLDTSGDYQRYVMIDNLRVHHIIHPETLMPGNYHRGVTVLAKDAAVTEYLATELFILSYDEGRALIDSLDEIEALWVMEDNTVKATEGMKDRLQR